MINIINIFFIIYNVYCNFFKSLITYIREEFEKTLKYLLKISTFDFVIFHKYEILI